MTQKRRALVLSDESARHPFLRSLPPHVRAAPTAAARQRRGRFAVSDLRDFLTAYCACLIAAVTFIS